jgi:hypothetical protein
MCSVCRADQRSKIEFKLIQGVPLRTIAQLHHVSTTALFRHKKAHLPQKLVLAKQHRETLSARQLLEEMADLKERLSQGLVQAEQSGKPAPFLAFAREFRQCLEAYFDMAERISEKAQSTPPLQTLYAEISKLLRLNEASTGELLEVAELLLRDD